MTCTTTTGAAGGGAGAYASYVLENALGVDQDGAAKYYVGKDAAHTVALKPDLSKAMADHLGIDRDRELTVKEMARLMNVKRATKGADNTYDIEGKKKHSPHASVAAVFGLDAARFPTVQEVEHVLAGKRADGSAPDVGDKRLTSAVRQFKTACGIEPDKDATPEQIQRVADGRIDRTQYRNKVTATSHPVGYLGLTFSSDKSVGIAYAHAGTAAERAAIRSAVEGGVEDAMRYAETALGVARRGAAGRGREEPAELAWFRVTHDTARPTTEVVRRNAQGEAHTEAVTLPGGTSDVDLHGHVIIPSSIRTKDGHIAALDLSRLDGEVKVIGRVFHAGVATRLRQAGVDVDLGPHGEARISAVSEDFRRFHSRRSEKGKTTAEAWAREQGKDWSKLSDEQRTGLIDGAIAKERRAKAEPGAGAGLPDIERWQAEAKAAGFNHRSVLRPGHKPAELTPEARIEVARNAALPLLDKAFQIDAVIREGQVREIAARGLVKSGLGSDAAADINAIVGTFKDRGITVDGEQTELVQGIEVDKDGRRQAVFVTAKAVELEENLISKVREAAADRSTALTPDKIDAAAERFLASHPHIDPAGKQWRAQLAMARQVGGGGRVSLSIGVGGSGKTSSVVAVLADAWRAEGRKSYGATVAWKANSPLRDAGLDEAAALDAFLSRVEKGKYKIDRNTVIVVDEVSQVGIKHQTKLLKLAAETGAQLVEIGDDRQTQAIEAPSIDLMVRAIGDENIPKLLTSIRQKTERGRAVAAMFRDGNAAGGVAALQEDGRLHIVPGGRDAAIEHTTALWRERTDANAHDPDHSLIVIAPTNASAREIGTAIRNNRRAAGEIGKDETTIKARDLNSGENYDLSLSVGDRVRLFTRVFDADTPRRGQHLGDNGDVVEITELRADGLRIRNEAGVEGFATWLQLKPWREPAHNPISLTLGYVTTPDAAQSLTRSEAIVATPDGSRQFNGYKAYTALSRDQHGVHLVTSDGAERKQVVSRQMFGAVQVPSHTDVVRNISDNLSRFPAKSYATDVLRQAHDIRGQAAHVKRMAAEPAERREHERGLQHRPSQFEHLRMANIVERFNHVQELAKEAAQRITQKMRDLVRQRVASTPSMSARREESQRQERSCGMEL